MALVYPIKREHRSGFVKFKAVDGESLATAGAGWMELELPQGGLKYADGMNYENADMGLVRGAMISGIDQDAVAAFKSSTGDYFSNIADPASRKEGAGNMVALTGMKVAQARSRVVPNPNTRAFFKGPNIREFSFNFKMMPTSSAEASNIEQIVREFRSNMYPSRLSKGSLRIGFHYPAMFKIEVYIGGSSGIMVRPRIKPCYLKTMNTSYNSGTNAILADNNSQFHFAETELSLTFSEEVTLSKEDIQEGF